jgi:hypothetical protein
MVTSITLEGDKALMAALAKLGDDIPEEVSQAVSATALEIQGDVKKRIERGPASGRVYQKYKPDRTHQASAPGQAPMTDSGDLAKFVIFNVVNKMTAEVTNHLDYAPMLEFGTFKIAPRPAWVPATEAAAPKFRKRIEAALARVIK